jgi:hypothetical protein
MIHVTRTAALFVAVASIATSLLPIHVNGQVAGTTLIGASYAEVREIATGWSAKRQLLGQSIYNEKTEKIGSVDDLIVSPNKALAYAVIGAGGFLGVAKHDVAIPVSQFSQTDGKFVLAGATKDSLKAMPEFEYAPR